MTGYEATLCSGRGGALRRAACGLRAWWARWQDGETAAHRYFVLAIALMFLTAGLAQWASHERQKSEARLRHSHHVVHRTYALSESFSEYVAEFRGNVLLNNAASQLRLEAARARNAETFAQLADATAHETPHRTLLADAKREFDAFEAFARETNHVLERDGPAAANARIRSGAGLAHIVEMRARLAQLQFEQEREVAALEAEELRRERLALAASWVALAVQALLVALAYLALRGEIRRRARAAEALAASEARFRSLTALSADWYWEQDAEFRFTAFSGGHFAHKWGSDQSEALGKRRWEIPGVVPLTMPWDEHRALLAAHATFRDFEYSRPGADGAPRYLTVSGEPVFDEQGRFTGYRGTARDITAQKLAEIGLRESEERHRTFLEMSPEAVFVSRDGRIVYANSAALRLFGAETATDLFRKPVIERVHPDSRAMVEARLRAFAEGAASQPHAEQKYLRLDGSAVDVEVVSARLSFDGEPAVLSVARDITERKEAEAALRRSEERLQLALDASGVAIWDTDLRTGTVYISERWGTILGGEARECATTLEELMAMTHPEDLERVRAASVRVMRGEAHGFSEEFRVRGADGDWRWIHILGHVVARDAGGRAVRMAGTNTDIDARKREERLLAMEHAVTRCLAQAETVSAGLQGAIAALCAAEGWDIARYFGVDESAGVLRFREGWAASPDEYRSLVEESRDITFTRGEGLAGRIWESGEPIWVPDILADGRVARRVQNSRRGLRSAFALPVLSEGGVIGVLAAFGRSVREPDERLMHAVQATGSQLGQFLQRKQTEERLAWLAQSDPLTGLPNRALFRDRLEQALMQARRNDWQVGLLFVDLDRFKRVNDTLGHGSGDELLRTIGARIQHCLRAGDTVARLGADEFAVVLPDLESAEHAHVVAQKILEAIRQPLGVEGRELFVGASVGITVYPHDALDAETLLKHADVAMYEAKHAGRDGYRFFTPEMNALTARLLELERDLRYALERGKFELHFQPKADIACARIRGAEALLRWRRADGTPVSPAEFVPVLEESGLIVAVGDWALVEACRQHVRWREDGLGSLRIAVNVSARQFRDARLVESVRRALEETGCPAEGLELEVTESMVMHDVDVTIGTLQALRALGVRVAVDDFGTGYSSLAYLKKLPVDVIKIDRAFVKDLPGNSNDAAIAAAIIGMARTLGYEVVAEGVETAPQREFLAAQGCHEIQGYLLSRPLPAAEFSRWLATRSGSE